MAKSKNIHHLNGSNQPQNVRGSGPTEFMVGNINSIDEIEAMGDQVVLRKLSGDQTVSGIVIPESMNNPVLKGVVVAVGGGAYSPYCNWRKPMEFSVGDVVVVPVYVQMPPMEFQCGSDTLVVVRHDDIKIRYKSKAQRVNPSSLDAVRGPEPSPEDGEIAWLGEKALSSSESAT